VEERTKLVTVDMPPFTYGEASLRADSGNDRLFVAYTNSVNCGSGRDHYRFDTVGSFISCEVEDEQG
jgi:hypothetical protein